MKKIIEIFWTSIILITISGTASAVETFRHPTCNVYLHPFDKTQKYDSKLLKRLSNMLLEKGYNLKDLNELKRLVPGEFHITMKRTLLGKVYKECLIELEMKQAKGQYAIKSDPVVFKSSKKRKFPRQTFKGKERCMLALQDNFFAINVCKNK